MNQREVSAKLPAKEGRNNQELNATVVINYADNVNEAVEMFGEESLLSNAFNNWRVTLQSNIRGALGRGETPEAIAERLKDAKMGVAQTGGRVDPVVRLAGGRSLSCPETDPGSEAAPGAQVRHREVRIH